MKEPLLIVLCLAVTGLEAPIAFGSSEHLNCSLGRNWKTVDTFRVSTPRLDAAAASIASTKDALFVAGQVDIDPYHSRWLLRRSFDRGRSWKTVDVYPVVDDTDAEAVGVATDKKRGAIYALGHVRSKNDVRHWIVRKSSDQGDSWTTIDRFSTGSKNLRAKAIAVDSSGTIYTAGTPGNETWIVRRSKDGGKTWNTIDSYKPRIGALPTSIALTPRGDIFVGGLSYERGTGIWTVRHRKADSCCWKTVDRYFLSPGQGGAVEGATADSKGNVVFVGRVHDSEGRAHWIARTAHERSPEHWVTIEDYFIEGNTASAIAAAATFSHGGELFITGGKTSMIDSSDSIFHHFFFTRRGTLDAFSFLNSDEIESMVPSNGIGAAMGHHGDIFTAGKISENGTTWWVVRKLKCE